MDINELVEKLEFGRQVEDSMLISHGAEAIIGSYRQRENELMQALYDSDDLEKLVEQFKPTAPVQFHQYLLEYIRKNTMRQPQRYGYPTGADIFNRLQEKKSREKESVDELVALVEQDSLTPFGTQMQIVENRMMAEHIISITPVSEAVRVECEQEMKEAGFERRG